MGSAWSLQRVRGTVVGMENAVLPPPLRLVVDNPIADPRTAGATIAEQLLEYASITRGLRVIELTFGPARLAWRLEAEGCRVKWVDLAVYGKEPLPAEWRRGFDVALVTSALHQAADPDGLIADVASCVRPGGICAGFEPGYSDLEPLQLEHAARLAGLALIEVDERQSGAALFWKGLVPTLRVLPRPTAPPSGGFIARAA